MEKKPLKPYEPNCKRNLLPVEECKMPANNASSIIIGDRTYNYYYLTNNFNIFLCYNKFFKFS